MKSHRYRTSFHSIFLNTRYENRYHEIPGIVNEGMQLVFKRPNDEVDLELIQPNGHALFFHSELFSVYDTGKTLMDYEHFSANMSIPYQVQKMQKTVLSHCLTKIGFELQQKVDEHSNYLIMANLKIFLRYCMRFCHVSMLQEHSGSNKILDQFLQSLSAYYSSEKPMSLGTPTVSFFANQFNLSTNYFGELIKKESGLSPIELIHDKIIEVAKQKVFDKDRAISDIARELGFKYPQHFTRLFKKKVGYSPEAFRFLT